MIVTVKGTGSISVGDKRAMAQQKQATRRPEGATSIVEYLPAMRDMIIQEQGSGLLEATITAIDQASKYVKDAKRHDLNLKVLPAMARSVSAPLSLTLGGGSAVFIQTGGSAPRSMRPDESHFVVPFAVPKGGLSIPMTGTYTLLYKAKATGKPKRLSAMYDLTEALSPENLSAAQAGFTARVPLYLASMAATISKHRLPALQLEFFVGLEKTTTTAAVPEAPRMKLLQAAISVSLLGQVHDVMLTSDVFTEEKPAHSGSHAHADAPATNNQEESLKRQVADVIHGILGERVGQTHGEAASSRIIVSCSVSQGERTISSVNGQEKFRMGEVSELLVALAVLRLADGIGSDRSLEWKLHDENLLLHLLESNRASSVARALKVLYKERYSYGRTPTVLELLTHTSGLAQAASTDAAFNAFITTKLLPHSSPFEAADGDILAHQLADRTTLISAPGSVVHPSVLGYHVLRACLSQAHIDKLLLELGLDETKAVKATDADSGDAGGGLQDMQTTSNDLARYMCCIEKSLGKTELYRLLASTVHAKYTVDGGTSSKHGHHHHQHVTLGGWNVIRIKLPVNQGQALSMVTLFKIGTHTGGSCLMVWTPALSLGIAVGMEGCKLENLFSQSQEKMGYGKKHKNRRFRLKHLLKELLHSAMLCGLGQVQRHVDFAHSRETSYPPNFESFRALCDKVPHGPTGVWREMMESTKQFQGDGTPFYPLMQSSQRVYADTNGGDGNSNSSLDQLLSDLKPIQIKRVRVVIPVPGAGKRGGESEKYGESYVLHDHNTNSMYTLAFDPDAVVHEGRSVMPHKTGCFRLHAADRRTLGEAVTFHLIPVGKISVLCIKYQGRMYITKDFISDCKEHHELGLRQKYAQARRAQYVADAKQHMPWLLPTAEPSSLSDIAEQQQPVEGLAGALFGGLLGVGLGAALFRPYPSYYYGYPYPAYPAYY